VIRRWNDAMNVSRDPDKAVVASEKLWKLSEESGMPVLNVICDSPSGNCISAVMLAPFLPPVGSRITLQNKSVAEVTKVLFDVVGNNESIFVLRPTVYAVMVKE
jgi:hypothetical protein